MNYLKILQKTVLSFLLLSSIFSRTVVMAEESESADDPFMLDEIVVTATKTAHTLKDSPVTTHLITKEEIEKSNAKTAGDALKWVPGVYIKSNGFARQSVNIEGLPDKYTLVLIDGQRQTGRHANAVDLSNIPVEMIERIEVIKGPSAVLYGSDAVAGVVNIITKKAPEKGYVAGSASYGTGDTVDTQMNFGNRYENFAYTFGVGNHTTNQMGDGYEYDAKNMLSNFQYDINTENRLALGINIYDEVSEYLDDNKFNGNLSFDSKLSDTSNLRLKVSDHISDRRDIRPGQTPREWEYDNYQAEIQYDQMIGQKQLLTMGGEYRLNNLESTEIGDKDEKIYSGFFQDEIDLFDSSLLFVVAGRIDNHDKWGTEFNPKGSLLYNISDATKLRLNAGEAFLAPSLDQLYKLQPHHHVSYWIIGNPDLQPETSVGYSADLEHIWANRVLSRLSFFRNDIKNMIASQTVGEYSTGESIQQSYNIDEAYSQGYEVELQSSISKSISTSVAYTYSETEDKQVKKQIRNIPQHTGKLNIRYYNNSYNFSIHYDMQYIGKMFTDSNLTLKSGDYFITNAKITKDILKNLQLFIAADNIFDEKPAPETSKYFDICAMWTVGFNVNF